MKSGTGDDPFADETADEAGDGSNGTGAAPDETPDADAAKSATDESADADSDAGAAADDEADADASTDPSPAADAESGPNEPTADAAEADGASGGADEEGSDDAPDIPWVLRRSSVKADRPNVTQFFLRDETDRAERRFQSDVEDLLDADVYTLDLREAAYLVAMRHPDEVAAELRDWGYEYLE